MNTHSEEMKTWCTQCIAHMVESMIRLEPGPGRKQQLTRGISTYKFLSNLVGLQLYTTTLGGVPRFSPVSLSALNISATRLAVRHIHSGTRPDRDSEVVLYKLQHSGLWGLCGICIPDYFHLYLRRGWTTLRPFPHELAAPRMRVMGTTTK